MFGFFLTHNTPFLVSGLALLTSKFGDLIRIIYTHVQRLRMDISRFMALYKCSYYYYYIRGLSEPDTTTKGHWILDNNDFNNTCNY